MGHSRGELHKTTYRLAAIDVDGTLVGPDLRVSTANAAAITQLTDAGITVLLASGRSHANILPFCDQLGLQTPVVSVHGAVVRHRHTGEFIHEEAIHPKIVEEITNEGRRLGLAMLHYRRQGIFLEKSTPLTEYDQTRNFEPQTLVPDLLSDLDTPVHKIIWLTAPARIAELNPEVAARFRGAATVIHTDPEYLEFISPIASKAAGVAAVANRMGLKPEQVIAFGDGNNDIPMLAWAGLGIAMGHASTAVKSAANHVGPDGPIHDALAHAIHTASAQFVIAHDKS